LPPLANPPPNLPKPPPPSAYDSYLKAVTPLYDSFLSAQASSSSSTVPLTGEYDSRPPSKRKADLPPLDSVPELFFDTSFNLANPSTWAELVNDAGPSSPRDAPGQDALSTHLDTLERHLVHEITLRSTSFFSALSNLQDLHSESASCLSRISELQSSLSEVGSMQARKGLDIFDAQERLRVLRMTEDGVRTMGELEEMLRIARSVVDHGDWAAGLGCLEDVVRWWQRHGDLNAGHVNGDEPSSTLPLSTLPALSALPEAFDELTHAIAEQLEASLSTLLLSMLSSAEPDVAIDNDVMQSSVEPILVGLVRCGHVDGLGGLWKEVVTVAVREGSRKVSRVRRGRGMADNRSSTCQWHPRMTVM
jgi:vacuolar protein sorting-associated protein 54